MNESQAVARPANQQPWAPTQLPVFGKAYAPAIDNIKHTKTFLMLLNARRDDDQVTLVYSNQTDRPAFFRTEGNTKAPSRHAVRQRQ